MPPPIAPASSSTDAAIVALMHALRPLLAEHAPLVAPALVPELVAFSAVDELPVWQAVEERLGRRVPAPFWAVAWPGAQALARAVLDGVIDVRGRVVVDVGCGSGLAAVAAARAGARAVVAVDVDPLAVAVALACAVDNGVGDAVAGVVADPVLGDDEVVVDDAVVFCGDLVYNVDVGRALVQRARAWRDRGAEVVLADSGRPFFDPGDHTAIATHDVEVPVAVEGRGARTVRVYRRP